MPSPLSRATESIGGQRAAVEQVPHRARVAGYARRRELRGASAADRSPRSRPRTITAAPTASHDGEEAGDRPPSGANAWPSNALTSRSARGCVEPAGQDTAEEI
jgi:hypothetical protein